MYDQKPDQEVEIDFVDYLRVVYKNRWMIISMVLISVCFTAIYTLMQPFKYKATVTFFPLNVQQYKTAGNEQPELKPKIVLEDLIITILQSREMADKIIYDLDLKNIWNQKLLVNTRDRLKCSTDISMTKGGVIKLDVITEDGKLSAKIANDYLEKLDMFNRNLQISTNISLVQVIDRAVPPEERMPRGLINKSSLAGVLSALFAVFFSFILDYFRESKIKDKLSDLLQIENIEEFNRIQTMQISNKEAGIILEKELKKKVAGR